jgi:SAM-dependent methyltransferase
MSRQAFSGTAVDYARYRPPYPEALLADLVSRCRLTEGARLLDLACGPGRVALAIANSFGDVWAIDLEPEMLDVGRAEAVRRGVSNVRWLAGRAEDLDATAGSFDLITIGEAFHRMERRRIAELCFRWLRPGGHLATIGSDDILSGRREWQRIVVDLARERTARAFPNGWASGRSDGLAEDATVIESAGFEGMLTCSVEERRQWTVDEVAGFLRSTSICSRRILGDELAAFESALRRALLSYDASGVYEDQLPFGFTLARKPA